MQLQDTRPVTFSAGQQLRVTREQLGLTMREVESASMRIAAKHGNDEYTVSPSRLSDIETKGLLPSIYRFYSLAIIYRRDLREVLAWYGIDLNLSAADFQLSTPPKSHVSQTLQAADAVQMPVRLDPAFNLKVTSNLSRMVEAWGLVPLVYLAQFFSDRYTYAYVGTEDFTMYPLLPPGTFLQVDETKTKVIQGVWRSEYERPIYVVETRAGHVCCWCTLKGDQLVLQPHPLSPVAIRVMKHPQEAEIVGQVVGIALKIGEWHPVESLPDAKSMPKEPAALN
jgi:transcriptional regulator with XRE-family HTH domain